MQYVKSKNHVFQHADQKRYIVSEIEVTEGLITHSETKIAQWTVRYMIQCVGSTAPGKDQGLKRSSGGLLRTPRTSEKFSTHSNTTEVTVINVDNSDVA